VIKLKKITGLILLVTIFLALTMGVNAQEITEIEISELNRSSKGIILKQLPYKTGDKYSQEKIELSRKRLFNSDLFNPISFQLSTQKTAANDYHISIKAEESGIFMFHPWEFGIRKATGLLGENFKQKIRNPHGIGLSYLLAIDWSDDSYEEFGLEYVGQKGRIYNFNYRNFDRDLEFNQKEFQAEGSFYQLSLETIPAAVIKNNYSLKIQNNDYYFNNQSQKQEFLIPAYSLNYDKNFEFNLELSRAFSLNDNYDNFNRLEFNLNKEFDLSKKSRVIADFKGGLSSDDTPFNFQFTAGAFSKNDGGIPIRGQEYEFAGTKYIKNTLEYQRMLWRKNWWGVVFIDTAKIAAAEKELGDLDWENDAGLGLIYYSYLGPIRADIGFDNAESSPVFNIGFGSSF
jgi:outer membrane protein assembly factor BamA